MLILETLVYSHFLNNCENNKMYELHIYVFIGNVSLASIPSVCIMRFKVNILFFQI